MTEKRADIYQQITDKIIALLEQGKRPWVQSWDSPVIGLPLRSTGEPYTGINVLLLWAEAMEKGYTSPYWFTFNQSKELKASVRKGERSSRVVFAGRMKPKDEENETSKDEERSIPFLKTYAVFNACQIDGLDEKYFPKNAVIKRLTDTDRLPNVEAFFANTGAKNRLNRDFGAKTYGDSGYAREELVAEIASCYLAADLGFEIEPRRDHADYIGSWLQVLQNDKRAIFQAASFAQKTCDYLHQLQPAAEKQSKAA